MIPFRLLAFCLLGVAMMLATGCAGKTVTAQPQGLNDARPVEDKLRHRPFVAARDSTGRTA